MDALRLYLEGDEWMIRYKGPHAERVRLLFGVEAVPTPYRASMTAGKVLATIRRLNPGIPVTLEGGR